VQYISILLYIFLVISLLVSCNEGTSPDKEETLIKNTNAYEQNEKLARSMNLGNALEAPVEGEWGVVLQANYFSLIKEAGFTAVRIPIRWSAYARNEAPYTINPGFINRVDWAIHQAKQNELAIVINMHHYEEIMDNPAAHKERFLGIWEELTNHYKNEPDDVIFEVLNEPHNNFSAEIWNEYFLEAIRVIRTIDPERTLIIGTAEWGGIASLSNLVIPDSIENIIVTVHYYNPFQFTHQGAEWVSGSDAWLGMQWRATNSELSALQSDLNTVASWAVNNDRPIFVGEFGAYNKADLTSRILWTRSLAREAEKLNMSWAHWEFCSGFGIYDPQSEKWNTQLLKALIP